MEIARVSVSGRRVSSLCSVWRKCAYMRILVYMMIHMCVMMRPSLPGSPPWRVVTFIISDVNTKIT